MSLYDEMSEITARQVTKTDTGDERVYGVMLGIVAKNYDKDMPGRVCVTIPTRDKTANELQWARLAMPSSGKEWGHYFLPEVGDQVLLVFEGGNIEKPYVIGSVPFDNNKFLTKSVDMNNVTKCIVTKHGSGITFEDASEGDGANDKLTVTTADNLHSIALDNGGKSITITDKDKENQIVMKTETGQMTIKAKSKLTIEVGESITLTLNGESGAVKVEAKEINLHASGKLKAATDGSMKLSGANFNLDSSSNIKLTSNGMVAVAGNPIKIG